MAHYIKSVEAAEHIGNGQLHMYSDGSVVFAGDSADRPTATRYTFRILTESSHEVRIGFIAESEEQAREKAQEWAVAEGTVGECCERCSIEA